MFPSLPPPPLAEVLLGLVGLDIGIHVRWQDMCLGRRVYRELIRGL